MSRVSIVVPTVGRSPLLPVCLDALRREGSGQLELVVVAQTPRRQEGGPGTNLEAVRPQTDHFLHLEGEVGFAAAVNRGLELCDSPIVGTVNDDAVVEPGWLDPLLDALHRDAALAAVQGLVLQERQPDRIDGGGLSFSRSLQAQQVGHGEVLSAAAARSVEIFGVSGTAALFRRTALESVARGRAVFDTDLGSYYEDVDLAFRLRGAGWTARLVPEARARHRGSTTGDAGGGARWSLVYGNRHLVLARHLGRAYPMLLPRLLGRDLLDVARYLVRGEWGRVPAIVRGELRAARRLPGKLHWGRPTLPVAELRRWMQTPGRPVPGETT